MASTISEDGVWSAFIAGPRTLGYRCRLTSELKGDRGKLFSVNTETNEKRPIEIEICRKNKFLLEGFVEVAVVSPSSNKPHGAYELAKSDTKISFVVDVQSDSTRVKFHNLRIASMKKGTKSGKHCEEDKGKFRLRFTMSFHNSVIPNLTLFSEVVFDSGYKGYRKPKLLHIAPSKCSMSEGVKILAAVAEALPQTIKACFVMKSPSGVVQWEKCVDCVLINPVCAEFNAPVFDHGIDKPVKLELMLLIESSGFRITSNTKSFLVYRDYQRNTEAAVDTNDLHY